MPGEESIGSSVTHALLTGRRRKRNIMHAWWRHRARGCGSRVGHVARVA